MLAFTILHPFHREGTVILVNPKSNATKITLDNHAIMLY